ncbi:hypothetical protein ES708_15043 [subsurface metagenome]
MIRYFLINMVIIEKSLKCLKTEKRKKERETKNCIYQQLREVLIVL